MKSTYKFDKTFGPVASFSGIIIFIAGLIATYYALTGLVLVFIGAFIGFTDSSTTIDTENKKVKFSDNIFGIIKVGKWISVDKNMQIGIKQRNKVYRTYSRSNRTLDLEIHDKKLYLLDENKNPILPILKVQNNEDTKEEINKISRELNISTIV